MNASSIQELQNLTTAMKAIKNRRLLERYQAMKFFLEGHSISHIARIIGRSRSTIRFYIRAYALAGIGGLERKFSSGRPSFLTDAQREQIKQVVSQTTPQNVGLAPTDNWTCPLVAAWIDRQFAVKYTSRGILDLLHDLDFRYINRTYTLPAPLPDKPG